MRAAARVPLHITGFWSPVAAGDPLRSGSLGAGLVLRPGVAVRLELCGHSSLVLNGEETRLRPVELLLDMMGAEACVEAWSPAPLGAGYAVSAALALGVASSLAAVRASPISAALRAAHVAEVEARTGLGDVAAISMGGFLEIRMRAGAPGLGDVETIPLEPGLRVVTVPLGREDTATMLAEIPRRAYEEAVRSVGMLLRSPSVELFARLAGEFSRAAGMMGGETLEALKAACVAGCLGFFVKKRVAVLLARGEAAWRAAAVLETRLDAQPLVLEPSPGGVTVFSLD